MKTHLIAYNTPTSIYVYTMCGRSLFNSDKPPVIDTGDVTEDNERNVCKTCLRVANPDSYPKEFTDTF